MNKAKKNIVCFILLLLSIFLINTIAIYAKEQTIVSMMPIPDSYKKDRKILKIFSVNLMNAGFIKLIKYEKIHRELKKEKINLDEANITNLLKASSTFNSEYAIVPKLYFNTNIITNIATSPNTNIVHNNQTNITISQTNNISLITNTTFTTNIIKMYDFSLINNKNESILYATSISNTNEIQNVSSKIISVLKFNFASSMLGNISDDTSIGKDKKYVDFWIEKKNPNGDFQKPNSNENFNIGDSIKFNFELYEDGYINIIYVSEPSTNILLVYPNNYNKGNATNNTILISNNIYQTPSESNNIEFILNSDGISKAYLIYSKNNKNIYDKKNLTTSTFPEAIEELKFIEDIKESVQSKIDKKNYVIKKIVIKCDQDAVELEEQNLPIIKINTE